jgi:hypothetical protein
VIQQNAQAAEEVSSSSDNLASRAGQMDEAIGYFKWGESNVNRLALPVVHEAVRERV